MVADPRETMNVATSERQVLTRLRRELRQVDARVQTPFEVDSQTREAMRSLGYLGSSAGAATASDLDPKAQLGALEPLWEGIEAAQAEDWSRAASRLRSVVAANPKILDAWQFLAISLHQQGLLAEALEAYREAFELSNGSPELAVPVAALSLEIGNLEDAALFARLASESQPGTMRLRILESQALSGLGRSIEALEIAQSAVEYAPEDVTALFQRGTLHHLLQYYEEAEADFERVLELAPRHGDAMAELAVLLMSGGDFEGARSMYERLLDLRPGDPVAVANLALLSDRPGG
jgi:Flp pilus assembly protein TadD